VSWDGARRVLAVRLDALGDVLMTTPALRALRAAAPGRHLTLLTSPAGAAAAALVPELDDVLVYDAPWMKATAPRADSAADHAMLERVRAGRFDAAVVFTVYSQNPLPAALLCYLADVPRRLAHCHENPYQLLTDWVPDPEPACGIRHEVERQLALVAAVGTPVVDLYALTNPQHTPWQVESRVLYHDVPCRNCYKSVCPQGHHDCLRRVAPETVASAAVELLQ
jgi:ADP-heptose:LPS heptosyltransferase